MKKIGIIFGNEQSFPEAVAAHINKNKQKNIKAEFMKIDAVKIDDVCDYNVIFDRISCEIPFYRSFLKLASMNGVLIVNNPFNCSFDDNFYFLSRAGKNAIPVPKTAILPSKEHPIGTNSDTMRNLAFPISWDELFGDIGFPAYIKPNTQNNYQTSYKVYNHHEFFAAYDLTGKDSFILQESIEAEKFYRCYSIGKKHVKIMHYDPLKPLNLKYKNFHDQISEDLKSKIEQLALKVSSILDLDFCTTEFAVAEGEPFLIDILNQSTSAELSFLHKENFNWLVETTADYLIELASR